MTTTSTTTTTGGDPDARLARAWAAGDTQAGDALLRRHLRRLRRFFRSKVPEDQIADLVQKTLEGCARGIHGFHGTSSFATYLLRIARHKLIDHYRRKRVRDLRLGEFQADRDAVADCTPGLSTLFAVHEETRLLVRGLQKLPLEQQILLELRYCEGLSGPALAELYACPEGTIRSRLGQARKNLEAQIRRFEADPAVKASALTDFEGWARRTRRRREKAPGEPSSADTAPPGM